MLETSSVVAIYIHVITPVNLQKGLKWWMLGLGMIAQRRCTLDATRYNLKGVTKKLTKLVPHFLLKISGYNHDKRLGHNSFER